MLGTVCRAAMKLPRKMGFQRGLAPFGGVQRQSLWAGLGGSPTAAVWNSLLAIPRRMVYNGRESKRKRCLMMRLPENAKRLAVFAYYDEDGAVDDYIPYLLEQVGRFCEAQVVVVNGTLTAQAREKLRPFASRLIMRANEGYDITAYKEGFLSEWESGARYDEVLFYNQTIFGPVCPLDAMFRDMGARDIDFWGLTRHKGAPQALWRGGVVIPPHVQSFFFAVRGEMLRSEEFLRYWRELPHIESYWDAVEKHEIVFTQHFAQRGYKWDTYVDTAALEPFNDYPLMGCPVPLLRAGCPFVKRKSFLERRFEYTTVPHGNAVWPLYAYLRDETDYPLRLIAQNLTRTTEAALAAQAIGPYFDTAAYAAPAGETFAAVLYIHQEAMGAYLLQTLPRLGEKTALFVLFASGALRTSLAGQVPPGARTYTIHCPGPQYLFETLWREVEGYPYLCYLSTDIPPLLDGKFEDATSLAGAVESLARPQCMGIFKQNGTFGLLLPPMPSHQENFSLGVRLPCECDTVDELLRTAGMRVPLGKTTGLASRGGMFFARTDALAGLTRLDWAASGLFEGIYPLWELLPPLAAQAAGYLTGFAASAAQAFAELENHRAMMAAVERRWRAKKYLPLDQLLFRMRLVIDFFNSHRYQMTIEQAADRTRFGLKQRLWYCMQILLKPKTFAKLTEKLVRHKEAPPPAGSIEISFWDEGGR